MRKIIITIVAAIFACAAFAETPEQIQKGSILIETQFTDMNLKLTNGVVFGFHATGGYFIIDKLAGLASIGLDAMSGSTRFSFSLGGRYYPLKLGPGTLFGDLSFGLSTQSGGDSSLTIFGVETRAGYALFLNRNVSVEPLMYLQIPFKKNVGGVALGFGAAISIYL
ncbi:MAG: hypothetical protein LBH91_01400 [Prevotellaceae bacterium]|jgi:hypothetical protein|nr:hypothetical protein [Prevotellaceae bacterium]